MTSALDVLILGAGPAWRPAGNWTGPASTRACVIWPWPSVRCCAARPAATTWAAHLAAEPWRWTMARLGRPACWWMPQGAVPAWPHAWARRGARSTGWWYATPLPGGEVLVSLMTDRDVARSRGLHALPAFAQAWAASRSLRECVPLPREPQAVASIEVHSGCVDRAAEPGWMAVGDALMSLDPLSSSGLFGALRDGLDAAGVLRPWLDGGDPAPAGRAWGQRAASAWARYLAQRRQLYGLERAWPDHPFWHRRHAPVLVRGALAPSALAQGELA